MSLRSVNNLRELLNYEFYRLYSVVHKYGGNKERLFPRKKAIKELAAGADPREYGVIFHTEDGRKKTFTCVDYDQALRKAEERGGMVVRLGRNRNRSFTDLHVAEAYEAPEKKFLAHADESGNIDMPDTTIISNSNVQELISNELDEAGWPKAIQYNSTRPTAEVLAKIHKRHSEIKFEDFAAAVIKHFETPSSTPKEPKQEEHPPSPFRSEQEKQAWYDTPVGQKWIKERPVPPIMTHTREELLNGRNQRSTYHEGDEGIRLPG